MRSAWLALAPSRPRPAPRGGPTPHYAPRSRPRVRQMGLTFPVAGRPRRRVRQERRAAAGPRGARLRAPRARDRDGAGAGAEPAAEPLSSAGRPRARQPPGLPERRRGGGRRPLRPRRRAGGLGVPVGISIGKSRAVPIDAIERSSTTTSRASARCAASPTSSSSTCRRPTRRTSARCRGRRLARALLARPVARERRGGARAAAPQDRARPRRRGARGALAVVARGGLDGVVATNTTVARTGLATRRPWSRPSARGA